MSSSDEEEPRPERQDTKSRPRISPPSKNRDDRRDKRHRSRSRSRSDEKKSSPDHRDKRDSRDYRDRRDRDRRRHSRSPRDRNHRRNDRRGNKPFIPQRPKLFQRPATDATTSKDNEDPNAWSTRIAAVASDDGQRSKFEKLLGMHKKDTGKAPVLKTVTEEQKQAMRKDLSKMESDLDTQFEQSRAFTHSFRGRGL